MPRKKNALNINLNLSSWPLSIISALGIGLVAGYEAYQYINPHWDAASQSEAEIRACFTPENQCQKFILDAISTAKKEILVHSYSFTASALSHALIKAKRNGVIVKILVDQSQTHAPYSKINMLAKAGIKILVDPVAGIAHNKVIIIDNAWLFTGSYNWTNAAEYRNSENLLLIQNNEIVTAYRNRWYGRAQNAYRYSQ